MDRVHHGVVTGARHVPDDAVRWGSRLARRADVPLRLVDAVAPEQAERRAGELRRIADLVGHPNTVTVDTTQGDLPAGILDVADTGGRALIVLPSDGRRTAPTAPWGSLAAALAAEGRHAVLRVRTAALEPTRIAVPFEDLALVDVAARFAADTGAGLRILVPRDRSAELVGLLRHPGLRGIDARIDVVGSVDPSNLRDAAARIRADVLVVPAHGHQPGIRWLVRHTDFTVMTVPDPRPAPAVAA
ncbi:MAG: hypothetical protein R3290_02920 [Acidimicrobiia bacterium]|nr:hypothetical protein [Acidimicrobiia bacterium]